MRVVALVADLIALSRIDAAARAAEATLTHIDDPVRLPDAAGVDLVIVDWGERRPAWGSVLAAWRRNAPAGTQPRLVLFGPHVDLDAHAEAKRHGIGPVMARGRLFSTLGDILAGTRRATT